MKKINFLVHHIIGLIYVGGGGGDTNIFTDNDKVNQHNNIYRLKHNEVIEITYYKNYPYFVTILMHLSLLLARLLQLNTYRQDNLIRYVKASIWRLQVTTIITPGDCWVHCTIIVVITITTSVLVSLVRVRFQLERKELGLQLLVVLRPVERCEFATSSLRLYALHRTCWIDLQ